MQLTANSDANGFWKVVSLLSGGIGTSSEESLSLEEEEPEEEELEAEPRLGEREEGGVVVTRQRNKCTARYRDIVEYHKILL